MRVPSQVSGFGLSTEPIKTADTVLPQASVISAGGPGSVASAGQETVCTLSVGAVSPPE